MLRHFVRQLNLLVLTLFILSIFSFWLVYLFPGSPLSNLSGIVQGDSAQQAALMSKYVWDAGVFSQYWRYLELLLAGDWGLSFSSGTPLWDEIKRALPASLELSLYALVLSLFIGIPLGFWSGLKHHKTADYSLLTLSVMGYSVPVFWLALILIMIFSLQLGWLPLSGRISLLYDIPHYSGFILIDVWFANIENKQAAFVDALRHMIMPTLSITVVTTAIIVRLTRRSVLEVMPSEFIQAAYTRGLSKSQVFMRHGVRNILLPIIPLLAMQATTLLTNAMIVEVIFSWPGIGNWLIQAIYQRDYPAIRAGMLAVSAIVVLLTISIDLFAKWINPMQEKESSVTA